MTYLAIEMSLYLIIVALISLALGWLFWGYGRRRRISALRAEMMSALQEERRSSEEARRDLSEVKTKLEKARDTEKTNTAIAVAEVQQLLDVEKQAASVAKAEAHQTRLDLEAAFSVERTTAANALEEAIERAEKLETEVAAAKTRETQIRAELEELRLMAGAEKLAAESARSETEQIRQNMQGSLDAERAISADALKALNDIQATLRRSLGVDISAAVAADNASDAPSTGQPTGLTSAEIKADGGEDDGGGTDHEAQKEPLAFDPIANEDQPMRPAVPHSPVMLTGNEITSSTPFDRQDDSEVTNDDVTSTETLAVVAETDLAPDHPEPEVKDQPNGLTSKPLSGSDTVHGSATEPSAEDTETASADPDGHAKPASLFDERPDDVDRLCDIGGIDADLEKQLNDHGYYQFKQLARISPTEIDWLAQRIASISDFKERIARDGWIEQARELQATKHLEVEKKRPRWWNRRRLQ